MTSTGRLSYLISDMFGLPARSGPGCVLGFRSGRVDGVRQILAPSAVNLYGRGAEA
jgi:hypothetical protein